jgi:hypothetical protein
MKDFLHGQHEQNGLITVVKLATALFFTDIQPGLLKVIGQPERE